MEHFAPVFHSEWGSCSCDHTSDVMSWFYPWCDAQSYFFHDWLQYGNRHGEMREPVYPVTYLPECRNECRKGRWTGSSPNPSPNLLNKCTELSKKKPPSCLQTCCLSSGVNNKLALFFWSKLWFKDGRKAAALAYSGRKVGGCSLQDWLWDLCVPRTPPKFLIYYYFDAIWADTSISHGRDVTIETICNIFQVFFSITYYLKKRSWQYSLHLSFSIIWLLENREEKEGRQIITANVIFQVIYKVSFFITKTNNEERISTGLADI